MPVPFIDTLDPAYDRDLHAVHREARARWWYARTPVGIIVLRYRDVQAVLHERRLRELGPDALRMAGITSGPLWEWFHQILSTQDELQEALPILARRLPRLEADGAVEWRTQVLIRGPARLPIGFAAAR